MPVIGRGSLSAHNEGQRENKFGGREREGELTTLRDPDLSGSQDWLKYNLPASTFLSFFASLVSQIKGQLKCGAF
jgi:hypothetical protein